MRASTAWPLNVPPPALAAAESLRHQDLPADEIEAGHQFGDGMLHLKARIDFEE